jgi:predicted RNA binding protein YcfA (HicA-like mRNA interferase family)
MVKSFTPDVISILRQNGCYFVRSGKGDHQIWYSPITNRNITVDASMKSRHTANEVLKQAGLPKAF